MNAQDTEQWDWSRRRAVEAKRRSTISGLRIGRYRRHVPGAMWLSAPLRLCIWGIERCNADDVGNRFRFIESAIRPSVSNGAISNATKVAVRQFVARDSLAIRRVPTSLMVLQNLGQIPELH
jgi:hypothetical protein